MQCFNELLFSWAAYLQPVVTNNHFIALNTGDASEVDQISVVAPAKLTGWQELFHHLQRTVVTKIPSVGVVDNIMSRNLYI